MTVRLGEMGGGSWCSVGCSQGQMSRDLPGDPRGTGTRAAHRPPVSTCPVSPRSDQNMALHRAPPLPPVPWRRLAQRAPMPEGALREGTSRLENMSHLVKWGETPLEHKASRKQNSC